MTARLITCLSLAGSLCGAQAAFEARVVAQYAAEHPPAVVIDERRLRAPIPCEECHATGRRLHWYGWGRQAIVVCGNCGGDGVQFDGRDDAHNED